MLQRVIIVVGLLALDELPGQLVQVRQLVVDLRDEVRPFLYSDGRRGLFIVQSRLGLRRLPLAGGGFPLLVAAFGEVALALEVRDEVSQLVEVLQADLALVEAAVGRAPLADALLEGLAEGLALGALGLRALAQDALNRPVGKFLNSLLRPGCCCCHSDFGLHTALEVQAVPS